MKLGMSHALKEWSVAVDALEQGETILLLRKGGIREQGGIFTVAHQEVLLYPTYEHQQPHLLKPDYVDRVQPVPSGWHPETVSIKLWAKITQIFQVSAIETVTALLPFHIWNDQFVSDRLKWKPRQPLYVMLLRVYRLAPAHQIAVETEYGGCKSWIDLVEPISIENATPVLSDREYMEKVTAIAAIASTEGVEGEGSAIVVEH